MHLAGDNYYAIRLDFKFYQWYIIWISDEIDGVLVNDDHKIIAFKTEVGLKQFWQKNISYADTEITNYNVYQLQQWLIDPYSEFDCNEFLNLWNLFTDISESIKLQFIGDVKNENRDSVYEKLFNGSDGYWAEDPAPVFNDEEINALADVMQNGIDLLLNNASVIENEKILP
ncbi:hypothetical protein AAFN85_22525 [Mucilaginibacter sp. CAU 1740]|uniref:hypothetical protein n=1 Tax=Mucilaginibacter sp. CAU 1740 TaxID=3140365 RepID=UPI00325BA117